MAARAFAAGPLSVLFEDGGLLYVRLGERELLRRVYVAVRDPAWGTAPWTLSELDIDEAPGRFVVRFVSTHRAGPIDYRWSGRIEGTAARLSFEMDGEAHGTFRSNRIGICVLHPIEPWSGRPCEVETVDGARLVASFPRTIHPGLPFSELRALRWEVAPSVRAVMRLEGDTFETEDQRQWTDASFKTYSRPLCLPYPFDVPAGTRHRQRFTLELEGEVPALSSAAMVDDDSPVDLVVDPVKAVPLPALGTTVAAPLTPHGERERERLQRLGLAFLRVPVAVAHPDAARAVAGAGSLARSIGVGLEVTAFLSDSPGQEELHRLVAAVSDPEAPISAVTLSAMEGPALSAAALYRARSALREARPGLAVGASPYPWFAELNRNRHLTERVDHVTVSFIPTVHMVDERTLVENLAAPTWMLETVRSFAPRGLPVGLAPVALRNEPRPEATGALDEALAPSELPAWADDRQASVFAAGWTLGHLAASALAGYAHVAYFRTRGVAGVMAGEAAPLALQGFPDEAAAVFPAWHVLADVAEWAGGDVVAASTSAPLALAALVLRREGRYRVLVANLGREARTVRLVGLDGFETARGRRLHPANAPDAARDPDAFRARPSEVLSLDGFAVGAETVLTMDLDGPAVG